MSATTFGELRLAVGAVAVGEHPHRHVVFPDAVDPAGQMIFGAERGLEKSVGDLAVGEGLLFRALARGDGGNFGGGGRRPGKAVERDGGQGDREYSGSMRRRPGALIASTLPQSVRARKASLIEFQVVRRRD